MDYSATAARLAASSGGAEAIEAALRDAFGDALERAAALFDADAARMKALTGDAANVTEMQLHTAAMFRAEAHAKTIRTLRLTGGRT